MLMEAVSPNEVKKLGGMLLKTPRAPIQANKYRKLVAVVIYVEEVENIEQMVVFNMLQVKHPV
jgi:hypothetical protein